MKRVTVILLVLAMVLCLMAGCGQTNTPAPADTTPSSTAPASAASAPATDTTPGDANAPEVAEAAASGETIKLGVLQVTSDISYNYFYPGIRIAVEETNANGGINGKLIELVERDSEGSADNVAQRLTELKEEGCVTVIGPAYDYEAPAASQWAEANEFPIIATSNMATSASIQNYSKWFFTAGPSVWGFMKAVAKEATDMGFSTYYVVANDGGTGDDYVNFCDSEMKKLNPDAKMVGYTNVSSAETDYNSVVNSIAALKPDFVVLGMAAFAWTSFVQQADMVGLWDDTYLFAYTNNETLYASIGDSVPVGNVRGAVAWLRNVDSSLNSEAVNKYFEDHIAYGSERAGFPIDYSDQSATCYLATKAAIAALEACDGDYSAAKIRDNLETCRFNCVFGDDIGFRPFDHSLEFVYYMSTTQWLNDDHLELGGVDAVAYPAAEILPTKDEMEAYAAENGLEILWN